VRIKTPARARWACLKLFFHCSDIFLLNNRDGFSHNDKPKQVLFGAKIKKRTIVIQPLRDKASWSRLTVWWGINFHYRYILFHFAFSRAPSNWPDDPDLRYIRGRLQYALAIGRREANKLSFLRILTRSSSAGAGRPRLARCGTAAHSNSTAELRGLLRPAGLSRSGSPTSRGRGSLRCTTLAINGKGISATSGGGASDPAGNAQLEFVLADTVTSPNEVGCDQSGTGRRHVTCGI